MDSFNFFMMLGRLADLKDGVITGAQITPGESGLSLEDDISDKWMKVSFFIKSKSLKIKDGELIVEQSTDK